MEYQELTLMDSCRTVVFIAARLGPTRVARISWKPIKQHTGYSSRKDNLTATIGTQKQITAGRVTTQE